MHFIFILLIVLNSACPRITDPPEWFSWLAGTWVQQRDNGHQRLEVWEFHDGLSLKGVGLKVVGTDTTWLEYLSLKLVEDKVLYIATVPDQNDGLPVTFLLVNEEGFKLTFENLSHDFPQRILYEFRPVNIGSSQVSEGDMLFVRVESKDGDGFDLLFHRK